MNTGGPSKVVRWHAFGAECEPSNHGSRPVALEAYLTEQFRTNRSWAEIARQMLTAQGGVRALDPRRGGESVLLLAQLGAEATPERTADVVRVFLGIQIQCAQCHDHPNDLWKREQFHALAAFFGRLKDEQTGGMGMGPGFKLVSADEGEYGMPDKDDPARLTTMHPRFLTGQSLGEGRSDRERREALADLITSEENYWFAAAFVNRVWGQMMGQAFYQPVDNLGPQQEAVHPALLMRLADSFRATQYDIHALYRVIAQSRTYQQPMRVGRTPGAHLGFHGVVPTRIRPDALWESLKAALGPFYEEPDPVPSNLRAILERIRNPDFRTVFRRVFEFDISAAPHEIEGSVPQVLMLMNNPLITARLQAAGDTPLARILAESGQDDARAIYQLYLQILGRPPVEYERQACLDYLQKVPNRAEAFEDLCWCLINSTEFLLKY